MIYQEPNKFARVARLEAHEDFIIIHGYQEYSLTRNSIMALDSDLNLKNKQNLLVSYFRPRYLAQKTVLDIGANSGFHSFWALQQGAEKAIAVDIDENYLKMLEEVKIKLGFHNLEIEKANVMDWDKPADVVLAIALIHWLYSCTALFGSLDSVINKLRNLTKDMLIVEWIAPDDSAIEFFHHIDWNKEIIQEEYTLKAFEAALGHYFNRYESIGPISPTRILYIAFCHPGEKDLSGPLPLIKGKDSLIQSRCLSRYNGIDYWSRIYDCENVICKQATLDLAEREGHFLSQLESDYFPRVLGSKSEGAYSIIILEKIQGQRLEEAISDINTTPERLYNFILHCLQLLGMLKQKGITHRDIRLDNLMVRNGKPVLIDFGWAISADLPYITPPGLGASERPKDGSFCDIYSMGKVIEKVNKHKVPYLNLVIDLMTEPNASLRITDIGILEVLFNSVAQNLMGKESDGRG